MDDEQVLRWLKQWDPCVFGAKRHSTSEEVLTSLRRQVTQAHGNGKMGGRGSFNNNMNTNISYTSDRFKSDSIRKPETEGKFTLDRPDEKVLSSLHPTSFNMIHLFLTIYSRRSVWWKVLLVLNGHCLYFLKEI